MSSSRLMTDIAAEDQGRCIAALLSDPTPHAGKIDEFRLRMELGGLI